MNKTIVSLLGFGAGIAAAAYSQAKGFNGKQMRKMTKRMRKAFK